MDDSELDAIRQARLQEMKQQQGGSGGNHGNQGQQKDEGAEEEMRASMMSQILSNEARERLARIRIVRGDRAKGVEDLLINMARSGQIQKKVSEQELVSLLDQISQQESKQSKTHIVYDKRHDDDLDELIGASSNTKRNNNTTNDDDSEDDFFD